MADQEQFTRKLSVLFIKLDWFWWIWDENLGLSPDPLGKATHLFINFLMYLSSVFQSVLRAMCTCKIGITELYVYDYLKCNWNRLAVILCLCIFFCYRCVQNMAQTFWNINVATAVQWLSFSVLEQHIFVMLVMMIFREWLAFPRKNYHTVLQVCF